MGVVIAGVLAIGATVSIHAQPAPSGPPAVGVVAAAKRPITETSEFLGRVEAVNRVNVVARVTAFLEKRLFNEGSEVKQGDELYLLERGPFEADLAAKKAQVAQLQATLENAKLTTQRAHTLLGGPAGQQSTYDAALANQRSLEAQVQAAQAQVQASQINLDYTDIRSPIAGRKRHDSATNTATFAASDHTTPCVKAFGMSKPNNASGLSHVRPKGPSFTQEGGVPPSDAIAGMSSV